MAMFLSVFVITAAITMTIANGQEPTISESERRGLAACLAKCPVGDMKCSNRCISQFQTRGLGAIVRELALGIVGTNIVLPI
jgi:hypothetical protein